MMQATIAVDAQLDALLAQSLRELAAVDNSERLKPVLESWLRHEHRDWMDAHAERFFPLGRAWRDALWRVMVRGDQIDFPLPLLALPPLFERWGWRTDAEESEQGWDTLAMRVRETLDQAAPSEAWLHWQAICLFAESLKYGRAAALRNLYGRFCACQNLVAIWPNSEGFGQALLKFGWFESMDDLPAHVADLALSRPQVISSQVPPLLNLLGFKLGVPKDWNRLIYEQLALPGFKTALAQGDIDIALKLELGIYHTYIKQEETAEHYRACFDAMVPAMREAGLKIGAMLPPQAWPAQDGPPVVAFFLHSASRGAHVEVLLQFFEGFSQMPDRPFLPRVYVFRGGEAEVLARFEALGIAVVMIKEHTPQGGMNWFENLLCLRTLLARDQVTALIFVSLPTLMSLAFPMRMAPVQIWWSMKMHTVDFPEIDGYVTGGTLFEDRKEIQGRQWRTVSAHFPELYDPARSAQAQAVRQRFAAYDVLLGTLARPEKIDNDAFMGSLAQILRAHPNSAYLWFGHSPLPTVQKQLQRHGIADRCFFEGWVDSKVYVQALDLFLDAFPFPCGMTAFESLAAAKPTLLYLSPESWGTGLAGIIGPALERAQGSEGLQDLFQQDGQSLYFCASSPEQYVHYASRLIQDTRLRHDAGQANRRFMQQYMMNPRHMAENYARHFLEIIGERWANMEV